MPDAFHRPVMVLSWETTMSEQQSVMKVLHVDDDPDLASMVGEYLQGFAISGIEPSE
jgi:hypothetical protein